MKPRVVFVDEDPQTLNLIREAMVSRQDSWGMAFAGSASDALMMLEDRPVDVVVSRETLSDMDGIGLMQRVKTLQPRASRVLLSGAHEHRAEQLSVVGPVHHVLDGADTRELWSCLDRLLRIQTILIRPEMRKLVGSVETLPSPSDTYYALVELLEKEDPPVKKVSELISKDLAMSAQVLRLTNSAVFALPNPVTNIPHAVQVLGFDVVRRVALLAGLFQLFEGSAAVQANMVRLGQNSLGIGSLCGEIARLEKQSVETVAQAECAGLMAHVGTLLLLAEHGEQYLQVLDLIEADGVSIDQAEHMVYGASHAQIGAYLLGLWGFALPVVEATAYHHRPSELPGLSKGGELSPVTILHAAQFLVRPDAVQAGTSEEIAGLLHDRLEVEHFEEAGLVTRLLYWRQRAEEMRQSGELL